MIKVRYKKNMLQKMSLKLVILRLIWQQYQAKPYNTQIIPYEIFNQSQHSNKISKMPLQASTMWLRQCESTELGTHHFQCRWAAPGSGRSETGRCQFAGASPPCPQSNASCWHHSVGSHDSQAPRQVFCTVRPTKKLWCYRQKLFVLNIQCDMYQWDRS